MSHYTYPLTLFCIYILTHLMSKRTLLWLSGIGIFVLLVFMFLFIMRRGTLSYATGSGTASFGSKQIAYDGGVERAAYGVANVSYDEASVASAPSEPRVDTSNVQERLIIKTADVSMVVDDVATALVQLTTDVTDKGGFVVNQSINKRGNGFDGYITFRIPSDAFDAQLQSFSSLGDVTSQSVRGQDVTEEYVDINAQLDNLRRTEAQFQQILTRANTIEDILSVQRELSTVRTQIERFEGRKQYLEQSAKLSTITVHLSTNPENLPVLDESDTWRPLAIAKDAVRGLRSAGIALANAVIWLVVYIPLWLVLAGVVWIIRYLWKKYEQRS